jgi:hypothetical protein
VGVDEHGKEMGSNRYLADSYFWATWEDIYMVKRGMEAARWRSKADTGKLIRALEGMKMEEGTEFPPGADYTKEPGQAVASFDGLSPGAAFDAGARPEEAS